MKYLKNFDSIAERDEFYTNSYNNVLSLAPNSHINIKDDDNPPPDEFWYVTLNNEFMEFEIKNNPTCNWKEIDSGPSILSNTYTNGKGIVKCSEPIKNFTYFNGGDDADNLLSLILPYGVQKVCDNCFYYMNLTELILPDTITGIYLNLSTNLKKLVLPKRLKTIQYGYIETYCGLEEIVLPEYLQKYYDIGYNQMISEPTLKKYLFLKMLLNITPLLATRLLQLIN